MPATARPPASFRLLSMRAGLGVAAVALILAAVPAATRENLGMYSGWGAFRDADEPRCYAIAMAKPSKLNRDYQPYATIGTWPAKRLRNQVHFRLSRELAKGARIVLRIGGARFQLAGGGGDAWAKDKKTNAAIIAKMRSAESMTVYALGANGKRFSNTWPLDGVASAIDAASLGCVKLR